MRRVLAARAVATFTADVPLDDLFRVNIVTDRMTAITKRASGPVHIVRRIESRPPVATGRRHYVLAPLVVLDLPLHRQWEIVFSDLCKVTLLPDAAIDERDLIL